MNTVLLHILVVLFVATTIRSTFGFGEALFAVPLLSLRIPLSVATPLAVLASITIATLVVLQDWRHIHVRSAAGLLGSTLLGLPLGLLLLAAGRPQIMKAVLAVLLIAFAVYCLRRRALPMLHQHGNLWLFGCGFCAGVLGGAYGMNGPPLVLYGALRGWSPQQFRATLQGYFLPASILAMGGFYFAGLWTRSVTHDYLCSLPVILPAIWLGRILNQRLHKERFLKAVYFALAGIGCVLLAQAVHL